MATPTTSPACGLEHGANVADGSSFGAGNPNGLVATQSPIRGAPATGAAVARPATGGARIRATAAASTSTAKTAMMAPAAALRRGGLPVKGLA